MLQVLRVRGSCWMAAVVGVYVAAMNVWQLVCGSSWMAVVCVAAVALG